MNIFRRTSQLCARLGRVQALKTLGFDEATAVGAKVLSRRDIKAAFVRKALTHHPDVNRGDSGATAAFQRLTEALDAALASVDQATAKTGKDGIRGDRVNADDDWENGFSALAAVRRVSTECGADSPTLEGLVEAVWRRREIYDGVSLFGSQLAALLTSESSFDVKIQDAQPHTITFIEEFSHELPRLVRRVVKKRSRSMESHTMHPLMLVGFLGLYSKAPDGGLSSSSAAGDGQADGDDESRAAEELLRSATCHEELCCFINVKKLRLDAWVTKFVQWERHSIQRLHLETTMGLALRLLSQEYGILIEWLPRLDLSAKTMTTITDRMRSVASGDEPDGPLSSDTTFGVAGDPGSDGTNCCETTVPVVQQPSHHHDPLAVIRELADVVKEYCRLYVVVPPRDEGIDYGPHSLPSAAHMQLYGRGINIIAELEKQGFAIRRHQHCCRVEEHKYNVYISASTTSREEFSRTMARAFCAVDEVVTEALQSVAEVSRARDSLSNGGIKCFPRLYNITPAQERLFWSHVERNKGFLDGFLLSMTNFNVHISEVMRWGEDGWVAGSHEYRGVKWLWWERDTPDGDDVALTDDILVSEANFDAWLRECTALNCMSTRIRELVARHSLTTVQRLPQTSLEQHLAFLDRYKESAARKIVERRHFTLNVGRKLAVGEDGTLTIPWHVDMDSLLLTLGGDDGQSAGDCEKIIGTSDSGMPVMLP